MRKVIINTDIGGDFDDLLALVMALHSLEIEIQGVVTTKEHIRDKALFARKLLDSAGHGDVPVFYFGERKHPVQHDTAEQKLRRYMTVHDYGFLNDEDLAKSDQDARISADAINFITQTITAHPHEITLISLAPNTPYAAALAAEPTIADKVKDAYLMGMALDTEENRNLPSEHNYRRDRHAFIALLESRIPTNVLPRDLTHDLFLAPDVLAKKTEKDGFHQMIHQLGVRFLQYMKRTSFRLADPITLGALLFPELYEARPAHVNKRPHGRAFLTPLPQDADASVQVYTGFDREQFYHKLCERL